MLEIKIEDVPDFSLIEDKPGAKGDEEYQEWYLALQKWVFQFGFSFVEIQLSGRVWMPLPNATLAIFMGEHHTGCMHAVVGQCVDGKFQPIFDPLGDEALPFETVLGVCLLVPTDPLIVVKMQRALKDIALSSNAISNKIVADSIRSTAREALGDVGSLIAL